MASKRPRKSARLKYAVPASETEEGKKREAEYHAALGRFVDMFSRAEIAVQLVLRFYAKLSANRAHILFGGTRADAGIDLIKSLAVEAGDPPENLAALTNVFGQLRTINTTRNSILHYGAKSVAEGEAYVLTALDGVDPNSKKVRRFPISVEILDHMTADLRKIVIHLVVGFAGRTGPKSLFGKRVIASVLNATWLYRPPPQRQG